MGFYCIPFLHVSLKMLPRTSLAAQWLRLCGINAWGMSSIPGQGNKIPYAMWCGQKIFKKFLHSLYMVGGLLSCSTHFKPSSQDRHFQFPRMGRPSIHEISCSGPDSEWKTELKHGPPVFIFNRRHYLLHHKCAIG